MYLKLFSLIILADCLVIAVRKCPVVNDKDGLSPTEMKEVFDFLATFRHGLISHNVNVS